MEQTFKNFIVDDSNEVAYEAAVKISTEAKDAPGFLNIHGAVGVGKTHLLKAIKNEIEKDTPLSVELVEGAQLVEQFIEIFKGSSRTEYPIIELYPMYADVDVLLIENLQCLVGKQHTQILVAELVHTMLKNGKTVVFTTEKQMEKTDLQEFVQFLTDRNHVYTDAHIFVPGIEVKKQFMERFLEKADLQLTETQQQRVVRCAMNCRELSAILKQIEFHRRHGLIDSNGDILNKVIMERGKKTD